MNFPVQGANNWSKGSYAAHGARDPGIDIFAAKGTPVVAVLDGTTAQVGTISLGGNRLWLKTARGAFYYAHLSAFAPGLRSGQSVKAGTLLGYVGDTGNAKGTGPHLHFGWSLTGPGGRWADPTALLGGGSSVIADAAKLSLGPLGAGAVAAGAAVDLAQAGPAGAIVSYLDTAVVQPLKGIAERLLLIIIGVALLIVAFREPIAEVAGRFTGAAAAAAA